VIPVSEQPEPASFPHKVRTPGSTFLQQAPHPASWKNREYWKRVLRELYDAHNGICAYSAEWIPYTTGDPSIDHFVPKSVNPQLAYEWSNYRLASLRFNSRKGDYQDVIDPFRLKPGLFFLHFPSLLVRPDWAISRSQASKVIATANRLKLNDELCISGRIRWIREFCTGSITLEFLKRNAPFIAVELQRQGLIEEIASIMRFDLAG